MSSNNTDSKFLDDLLEPGSTLMVGTESASGLEFRPLTTAAVDGRRIDILLDTDEDWVRAFNQGDLIYVTMSDTKANTWLSMRGRGSTTTNPARIDELWNPFASAYFDAGRATPGIAVLTIEVEDGRYWSAPSGRLGSLISWTKAAIGSAEGSGEHGDLKLRC